MPGVRARFVRDVIELLERSRGQEEVAGALSKVASRLGQAADPATLRAAAPGDAIPLSDAEEILLGLDASLGDGSGQLLELTTTEYFARVLGAGSMAVPGDLMATVARMRAPLEHVFVEQRITFDLADSSLGFSVFLGVPGRPRAARLLRHVAVGAVLAAQRFARQGMADGVRVRAETLGERVRLDVRLRDEGRTTPVDALSTVETGSSAAVPRRNSRPHLSSTQPTLDAVERIIARAATSDKALARANNRRTDPMPLPARPSSRPPSQSGIPPARPSGFHRSDGEPADEKPPTSKRSR